MRMCVSVWVVPCQIKSYRLQAADYVIALREEISRRS